MHYTHKLSTILNLNNQQPYHSILNDKEQQLVSVAAYAAAKLHLSGDTMSKLLRNDITEAQIVNEMQHGLLQEIRINNRQLDLGRQNRPKGQETDQQAQTWKPKDSSKKGPLYDRLKQAEQELEKRRGDLQDVNRQQYKSDAEREEKAFGQDSSMISRIKDHTDRLVDYLVSLPQDQRADKVKEVVKGIINAANQTLSLQARQQNGQNNSWRMAPKYRPNTGLDKTAATKQDHIPTAPGGRNESIINTKKPITELFGALKQWLSNRKGASKQSNEIIPAKEISGIIDALHAANISPHGQTTMLQNTIKYIMGKTGTKDTIEPAKREKIIDNYVQRILDNQKHKKEIGFSVNISKMTKPLALDVLNKYKESLTKRGYKAEHFTRNGGNIEFVATYTGKLPGAKDGNEVAGHPATEKHEPQPVAEPQKTTAKAKEIGQLTRGGTDKPGLKVIALGKKAYVLVNGEWKPMDRGALQKLWDGEEVAGLTLHKASGGASVPKASKHGKLFDVPRPRMKQTNAARGMLSQRAQK